MFGALNERFRCSQCEQDCVAYDIGLRGMICDACGLVARDHVAHVAYVDAGASDCGRVQLPSLSYHRLLASQEGRSNQVLPGSRVIETVAPVIKERQYVGRVVRKQQRRKQRKAEDARPGKRAASPPVAACAVAEAVAAAARQSPPLSPGHAAKKARRPAPPQLVHKSGPVTGAPTPPKVQRVRSPVATPLVGHHPASQGAM